jgi:copper transport protein
VVFRRTVFAETGVAVAVLVLSSVLVTTQPARVAFAADRDSGPTEQTAAAPEVERDPVQSRGTLDQAASAPPVVSFDADGGPDGQGRVMMLLEPARVGRTSLHVAVLDAAGAPRAVQRVALALVREDGGEVLGVDLVSGGPGHYLGPLTLPSPGSWKAVMRLGLRGGRSATIAYPLQVAS